MQEKVLEFGLSVLPYSPDLALSDFHLFFNSLQNALNDKKFSQENVENFLSWKPVEFYLRGIN